MSHLSVSALISTKNRPDDLRECVQSVLAQSVRPGELILVDASDGDASMDLVPRLLDGSGISFAYHRQEVIDGRIMKTAAWNRATRVARGDIVVFLDDDVILEPDYIQQHLDTYDDESLEYVGGVYGRGGHSWGPGTIIAKLFLMPASGSGTMQASGFPNFPDGSNRRTRICAMSGGVMSLRREIFQEFEFDEWFVGYSYGEDVELTYRVGQRYALYYNPRARLLHKASRAGRQGSAASQEMMAVNHYYIFRKHLPQGVRFKLAFAWSEFGHIVVLVRLGDLNGVKGRLEGWRRILGGQILVTAREDQASLSSLSATGSAGANR